MLARPADITQGRCDGGNGARDVSRNPHKRCAGCLRWPWDLGDCARRTHPGVPSRREAGTAYKIKMDIRKEYVASFVALRRWSDPRIVVAVMIDEPAGQHLWWSSRRAGLCGDHRERVADAAGDAYAPLEPAANGRVAESLRDRREQRGKVATDVLGCCAESAPSVLRGPTRSARRQPDLRQGESLSHCAERVDARDFVDAAADAGAAAALVEAEGWASDGSSVTRFHSILAVNNLRRALGSTCCRFYRPSERTSAVNCRDGH